MENKAEEYKEEAKQQQMFAESAAAEALKQHLLAKEQTEEANRQRALADSSADEAVQQHELLEKYMKEYKLHQTITDTNETFIDRQYQLIAELLEKKESAIIAACCLLFFSNIIPSDLYAQSSVNRDTIFVAAREIINETTYCALVTIDSTGQPQIRTMNPFPANDEFITWFATSRSSRKVKEIKNNPKVCVYYADHKTAIGYVNITGRAEVIDDKELLLKMKRDYWESIPDWQNNFVLIKVFPITIEVINYKHGLTNDPKTFRAPSIAF